MYSRGVAFSPSSSSPVWLTTEYTVVSLIFHALSLATLFDLNSALPDAVPANTNPNMSQFLNKQYVLDTSENFDEIMKELGVSWFTRKAGSLARPTVGLTKDGDTYTLTSESTFKNTVTKFKLGEEFDEETPDGRNVKSVITQEGNKLIQIQKGEKTTTIVREFTDDEIKMTLTVGDITCTRIYKRIPDSN